MSGSYGSRPYDLHDAQVEIASLRASNKHLQEILQETQRQLGRMRSEMDVLFQERAQRQGGPLIRLAERVTRLEDEWNVVVATVGRDRCKALEEEKKEQGPWSSTTIIDIGEEAALAAYLESTGRLNLALQADWEEQRDEPFSLPGLADATSTRVESSPPPSLPSTAPVKSDSFVGTTFHFS